MESDVEVEVKGDGLSEGLFYIASPMAFLVDGMAVAASPVQRQRRIANGTVESWKYKGKA